MLGSVGGRLFASVGCAKCHVPSLRGRDGDVTLYSDLLLHDMGAIGDGIEQGAAGARDIKTAPLWGLRARPRLLHDGRAATIADAILGHAGEATAARNRFAELDDASRQQLIDFLSTL